MRILSVIGDVVSKIDTDNPFTYWYGSNEFVANAEADQEPNRFAFLIIPPFTMASNSVGAIEKTYPCTVIFAGKTDFHEKQATHKDVWGQMEHAATRFFKELQAHKEVRTASHNNTNPIVNAFDANFDGFAVSFNVVLTLDTAYC
jgi:hypothetical protein